MGIEYPLQTSTALNCELQGLQFSILDMHPNKVKEAT